VVFAQTALWGQFEILEDSQEIRWAGIATSFFTALIGFILVLKVKKPETLQKKTTLPLGQISSFLQGLIITAANPAFLLFWLFVANFIIARMDKNLTAGEGVFFGAGVIAGDVLWFTSFTWLLTHLEKRSREATLKKIRLLVGVIFFSLGVLSLGSYVIK
jgi:threonine/homoserine/homoserine lactone efflux protein